MIRPRVLLALLAILVVVVADRAPAQPQDPPPDDRPRAVIGLGDSTVAGEGAGDYAPGTRGADGNACHRSANAAIAQLRLPGVTERVNLACSGAASTAVALQAGQPSQASRLTAVARRYRVEAVVLAVGANDAPRFADIVLRCVEAWAASKRGAATAPSCSQQLAGEWTERLNAMAPRVARAVTDVQRVMGGAGYAATEYDLVLQSYPSPVTERIEPALQDLSGCPLRLEDLTWLRTVAVPQLSTALRGVAERTGSRFLDLSRAAEGHEACAAGSDEEWMTRLTVDFEILRQEDSGLRAVAESFHPNATGHVRIAACLGAFLRTAQREAACRPDGDALRLRPLVTTSP